MTNVLQRKKYERMLYSRPVILMLIILSIFLAGAVVDVYEKAQSTGENLVEAEIEFEKLGKRGDLLEERLSSLGTPRGVEAEIRDKFNVVKEGESVIMLLDVEEVEGDRNKKNTKSLWERIKSIFK